MSIVDIFQTMEYGPAPESTDTALDWLETHGRCFDLLIGNAWTAPASGEYFEVVNPATGKQIAMAAQAGEVDVDAAVSAARNAFPVWSAAPDHTRARYLYALARQVQRHARLLAVLETLDNGKPIRESRDIDIPLVARHFYYHAGWAQLLNREFPDFDPVGVVGQIIPWNFPLLMLAWKVAPALAAGNTIVLKPAEFTPLTAIAFAELVVRAGLPPGVLNIVTGDGRTGEHIVRHADVDKIAFTGSTEVGRIIRRETAGSGKRLSLELGGKSPFLVFEDADLDSVVEGVVDAIWFNQGQVCCAGSRLLVQESVEERLLPKLRARMEHLRVGNPLDKGVDIGAIVAPVQLQKITGLVEQGIEEGAMVWQPSSGCPTDGYFYPPTLCTNVTPSSTIAQEEIFGPVLVAMTFRTPSEAVELANNTRYGLAASVWTEDINVAGDVARQLKAGTVWINSTNLFDAASGFGGYGESGFGREGGKEGMYEYLKPRYMVNARTGSRSRPPKLAQSLKGQGVLPEIDRTAKLFIGGKQVRPDSGYTQLVRGAGDTVIGEVGAGNRKDIRNAVEAARGATNWAASTAHNRAQVLYYIAENLSERDQEFAGRIVGMCGCPMEEAEQEVQAAVERLFTYAAWTDKYDGEVHRTPLRGLTIATPEPLGVLGIVCPLPFPLLAFVSLAAPALAMGNRVVVVPSEDYPLSATDLYQVFETSDVPPGVINIVTGPRNELAAVIAGHDDVDGIWYFGDGNGVREVEYRSASNMKRTWTHLRDGFNWLDPQYGEGKMYLREATQVKNIWTPTGA